MSDIPQPADSAPGTSQETIDVGTPEQLQSWADRLSVTTEALETAVKTVGPRLDRIKDFLLAGRAGHQEGG